ncbi:MAG TPA: hypothetical protein VHZ78_08445 [Rhizomicrobium sp.]|jgi:hypothetical protein|nr:hypothetical protein [Rhizomicrobium sp.]
MQTWTTFYEMLGGAAATLLGLLFVSVSLNAEAILGAAHQHTKRLAEQAFQNYLCVLLISLLVCFPGMRPASLGQSVLWTTGIWAFWVVSRIYLVLTGPVADESRIRSLRRYITTFIGFGALICGGVMLLLGQGDYTDFIGIGAILLLISATVVSWELLIRIAERRYAPRRDE